MADPRNTSPPRRGTLGRSELSVTDLPKASAAGSACPDESVLIEYASSPPRHPDRKQIAEHVRQCTACALAVGEVARLRQDAQEATGSRGALKYRLGAHPAGRRFEDHAEKCGRCRTWLAVLRPFVAPVVADTRVAWGTAAVCAVALVGMVLARPRQPAYVELGGGIEVPAGEQLDARGVADYLARFSRPDLSEHDVAELRHLTNQLESRLYSEAQLREDPAFVLTVAALFQRRFEVTGEQRARGTHQRLLTEGLALLGAAETEAAN